MRKEYEAPCLFVDEYVADTMIASSYKSFNTETGYPKNGNAANNHDCWGCDAYVGGVSANGEDACWYTPDSPNNLYERLC